MDPIEIHPIIPNTVDLISYTGMIPINGNGDSYR